MIFEIAYIRNAPFRTLRFDFFYFVLRNSYF